MVALFCILKKFRLPNKEDAKSLMAYRIAAHAADLAKGHPSAQIRDNVSQARFEFRWEDQLILVWILKEHESSMTKPCPKIPQSSSFRSMCGPKFCS